ncbi:MAG: NADPH-dependent FMN reductase [Thermomicrobiales bacterium]
MSSLDGNRSDRPVHILGLGGSMRPNSKSFIALEQAIRLATQAGAETTLVSVRDLALPVYDPAIPDHERPFALQQLLDQVRAADAFVFCSPTYHGTISGAVKNVLDALNGLARDQPRYLGGKPVGLMALGGGSAMNTITALDHATRGLNGLTTTTVVTVPGNVIDEEHRQVTDGAILTRLGTMVQEVIDLGERQRRADRNSLTLAGG